MKRITHFSALCFSCILFMLILSACEKEPAVKLAGTYTGKMDISGFGTYENSEVVITGPALSRAIITFKKFPLASDSDITIYAARVESDPEKYTISYTGSVIPGMECNLTGNAQSGNLSLDIIIEAGGTAFSLNYTGKRIGNI